MALQRFFFGFWKITESVSGKRKRESRDIGETEFQLTTTGNVFWKTTHTASSIPLMNCKAYVVHKCSYAPYCNLKFATASGHIVDCDVESIQHPGGFVFNDGWCTYTCKKLPYKYGEYPMDNSFSFLPALQNSYFSDLVIRASNKKEFQVHRCILKYAAPKLDWFVDPPPLSGYSEDVLNTILHFLYSGCLPNGLNERILSDVISVASDLPGMEKLISLCLFQKENLALKERIIDLVTGVGLCISRMRDIFTKSEKKFIIFSYEFDELYSAVKKSFQEGAVAMSKFLLICKIYANAGTKLSEEDDLEILEFILSKVPIYNNQLREYTQNLIGTIRRIHAVPDYWESLMTFLVPKVQDILDTISSILLKIGECSAAVASAFQDHFDDFYANICPNSLNYPMETDFEKSPMSTVLFFVKEFKGIVFHFEKEKRRFNRIDFQSKARLISLALEEFLAELTGFRGTFVEFIEFLEKQIIRGKIYFGMRIIAMKANDVMSRVKARRTSLVDLLLQFCDLVERDAFFEAVAALGFLDPPPRSSAIERREDDRFPVVESACKPPPSYLSHLSELGSQLLETRDLDDMIFDVICINELEGSISFNLVDSDDSDTYSDCEQVSDTEVNQQFTPDRFEVKAHRAIVGSRCDWFRLALASGMKEDITRKIEIRISPSLFSFFIEFLYTGSLDRLQITFDDLLNLLLVSDRYDFGHLKEVCEFNLKRFIDEKHVFSLFNVADRCNANKLKLYCEDFITENPTVVSSPQFRRLPENLKREAIICSKGNTSKNSILVNILCNDSFEELEESLAILKKRLNSMGVQATDYERMIYMLRPKLEKTMVQLRERVGPEVPRSVLIRTILDTDYDVNRAAVLYTLRNQAF